MDFCWLRIQKWELFPYNCQASLLVHHILYGLLKFHDVDGVLEDAEKHMEQFWAIISNKVCHLPNSYQIFILIASFCFYGLLRATLSTINF